MAKASKRSTPGVVSKALVGASRGRAGPLDPALRSFLFRGCFARVTGDVLTVSFPAGPVTARLGTAAPGGVRWTAPRKVPRAIDVRCAAGTPAPFDRAAWPKAPAPALGVRVRFHGAVRYCRLVLPEGPALLVQGTARSIRGLAGSARPFDTAELLAGPPAAARGAKPRGGVDPSGPHQPFP
jgi:hypothetical protein